MSLLRSESNTSPKKTKDDRDDDAALEEDLWDGILDSPSGGVQRGESMRSQAQSEPPSILTTNYFNWTIWALVALNTVQMGVEVDYPEHETFWLVCENFFTAAFALEMLIKLWVLRCDYFKDKANWLDFCIVMLAIVDVWLLTYLFSEDIDLRSVSVLRVLRLLRLVRIAKLVKQSRKVILVLHGLFAAMQVTSFVGCLLALSIYCCAIFCTSIIGKQKVYPGYTEVMEEINEQEVMSEFNPHLAFGSMGKSMLTLFSIAIFAEWTEIVRPVYVKQPGLVIFFVAFALFVCFGVMNVIIGMIVDSVMDYSNRIEHAEEEQLRKSRRSKVRQIVGLLDTEYHDLADGLHAKEVAECMRNETMKDLLRGMDLPAGFTGREMMDMLDNNGSGTLQREEFVQNLFRLIDGGGFQQSCMTQSSLNELKRLVRENTERLEARLQAMEARLFAQPANANAAPDAQQVTRAKHGTGDSGNADAGTATIVPEVNGGNGRQAAGKQASYDPGKAPSVEHTFRGGAPKVEVQPGLEAQTVRGLGASTAAEQLEAACREVTQALQQALAVHTAAQANTVARPQQTTGPPSDAAPNASQGTGRANSSSGGVLNQRLPEEQQDKRSPQRRRTSRESTPSEARAAAEMSGEANSLPGAIQADQDR
mmetsp:Transcript_23913/g.43881  ORF Transcript_23913/g.43881 Transcript_23913/m.43881 type:complete len:650 (-) Transcript_23913:84-2033(-)